MLFHHTRFVLRYSMQMLCCGRVNREKPGLPGGPGPRGSRVGGTRQGHEIIMCTQGVVIFQTHNDINIVVGSFLLN